MKIQKNIAKKIIIPSVVLGLAAIGVAGYLLVTSGAFNNNSGTQMSTPKPLDTIDYDKPTDDQKDAGNTTKTDTVNKNTTTPSTINKVTITSLQQTDSTLQIRSYIDLLTSIGSCKLTLSNATKSIEKTVQIQASADVSTCQGFDVPLTELSTGSWSVKVQYIIGQSTTTATSTIEIK